MSPDGRIYRLLEVVANYSYLNFLWLISSLPLITIFPATAALFAVIRKWTLGEEPPITKTFFAMFMQNMEKSYMVALFQIVVTVILAADIYATNLLASPPWNIVFMTPFLVLGILFLFVSVYIYPILVHFELTFRQLIRNSLYLSVSYPWTSLLIILVILCWAAVCSIFPFLIFIFAISVCSSMIYRVVHRLFERINVVANLQS